MIFRRIAISVFTAHLASFLPCHAQEPSLLQVLQSPAPSARDAFGQNLAAEGTTLAVGERRGLSIFTEASPGTLTLQDRILFGDGAQPSVQNGLNAGLAIEGDRIAVTNPATREVWILERSGSDWQRSEMISDPVPGGAFGGDLDIDGTRLVIGEASHSEFFSSDPGNGRVWVSELADDANSLIELHPQDALAGRSFGWSVAVRGDWIAVGAPLSVALDGELFQAGRVFIFRRDAAGDWSEIQCIESSALGPVNLGWQVQFEGSELFVLETFPTAATLFSSFVGVAVPPDPGVSRFEWDGTAWARQERTSPLAGSGTVNHDMYSFDCLEDRVIQRTLGGNASASLRSLFESRNGVDRFVTESLVEEWDFTTPATARERHPVAYVGGYVAVGLWNGAADPSGPGRVEIFSSRPGQMERFCGAGTPCDSGCPCTGLYFPGQFAEFLGGCPNRDQRTGSIETQGVASISNDTLGVRGRGLNSNVHALLMIGTTRLPISFTNCATFGSHFPGFGVSFAGSNGLRCIGGRLRRAGLRMTDMEGNVGIDTGASAGWGAADQPPRIFQILSSAVAGQPLHLQIYYSDPMQKPCSGSINTTDATTVMYVP